MVRNFYPRFGKRALDIVVSASSLIVLSPVLAITAITIRRKLGRPIIFKHSRPGKDAAQFELYKFRTMTNDRDQEGNLLPDKERITSLGTLLRVTSLDELPELLNILKGDMSLIGPRPLLSRYLPYYTSEERERFKVRPGLTGLAQVYGRNSVRWNDRLSHDAWYAHNVSFLLDLRIFLKTLSMVATRQGVATVPNLEMESLDIERAHDR